MHATFYALLCTLSTRAFLIGFLSKKALLESSKLTRQDSVAVHAAPRKPLERLFWETESGCGVGGVEFGGVHGWAAFD